MSDLEKEIIEKVAHLGTREDLLKQVRTGKEDFAREMLGRYLSASPEARADIEAFHEPMEGSEVKASELPPAIINVIFNEIPERLRIFKLNLSFSDAIKVRACHGKCINNDDMTPEMEWLNERLQKEDALYDSNKESSDSSVTINGEVIVFNFFM